MRRLYDRFLAFEVSHRFFEREILGVRFWHLIRLQVYGRFVLPTLFPLPPAHPDLLLGTEPKGLISRIAGFIKRKRDRLLDATWHNPMLSFRARPILFSLTPRQAVMKGGRRVTLILDFFTSRLTARHAVLEYNLANIRCANRFRHRLFHLPPFDTTLAKAPPVRVAGLSEACEAFARELAAALKAEFSVEADVRQLAACALSALRFRAAYLPVLKRWLRHLKTRVVVTAVHYNNLNFTLAEAAHDLGLKVVELQHGTIYPMHGAYNLPVKDSVYAPDTLIAWGRHWISQTRNYPRGASVPLGYPYLEACRQAYCPAQRSSRRFTVLFVSQGNVGGALSRAARELSELLPRDRFAIVYKLHPNETRSWRTLYPHLLESAVDVVANTDRNIYACLSEADAVVGVSSTSLVEALAWERRVFVLTAMPSAEIMAGFEAADSMEGVADVESLAKRLLALAQGGLQNMRNYATDEYFCPNAAARIAEFLDGQVTLQRNKEMKR